MKRLVLAALLGVALSAAWLGSADTAATKSDPDLVVIYLSGWQSLLDTPADVLNTWKNIKDAVENAAPGRVLSVPYSYKYQKGSYESPTKYTQKDTNQSLDSSADALSNELADLGSRYPRARFLLVGHSLGGVVASYWAGKTSSSAMQRVAGVVTFDSPVEGVVWADVYRALVLAKVVTGDVGGAIGLGVLRGLFDQALGDGGPVIDQLDKGKTPQTFKTVEKSVANLTVGGAKVYNGFECWDLFIICTDARTPGADWHEFKLAAFADCRTVVTQMNVAHVGNRALVPDFSDPVEAGGSAKLEPAKAKKCYTEMHGRVLQVPEAGTWVKGIASSILAQVPVPAEKSVRDLDWKNLEYQFGTERLRLHNGTYAAADPSCCSHVVKASIEDPVFADINGDGVEDAIITQRWTNGGNFAESTVSVFQSRGGAPDAIGILPSGTDVHGAVLNVAVQGKTLAVSRSQWYPGVGHVAPAYTRTEYWSWTGSALVEDTAKRTVARLPSVPAGFTEYEAFTEALKRLGVNREYGGNCYAAKPATACSWERVALPKSSAPLGGAVYSLRVAESDEYLGSVVLQVVNPFPTYKLIGYDPAYPFVAEGSLPVPSGEPTWQWGGPLKVQGTGCVNLRESPTTSARTVSCVAVGRTVRLAAANPTAVQTPPSVVWADGYLWVRVADGNEGNPPNGWMAARWLCDPTVPKTCRDAVSTDVTLWDR